MSATRVKLPDDLKRRIAKLAASTGQTPHAFMVNALAREALGSGRAHSLDATFDYLAARVGDKNPRRPRARS